MTMADARAAPGTADAHRVCVRALTLTLAGFLAVCALPAGTMLVIAPDGHLLGASTAWLRAGLPFATYLVPGVLLAGLIGGGAIAVLVLVARRSPRASLATALLGVVVMVWIALQLAMVTQLSALHAVTFAVGMALAGAAARAESVWIRWVAASAAGELVGLGALAAAVALLAPRAAEAVWFVPGVILLGGFEGLVVGGAQAWALRRAIPRLDARAWIAATVTGAITAWLIGMLPSLFLGGGRPAQPIDDRLQLLLAAALGLVAGPILAVFQVAELRRHVRGAGWWLAANAIAWAAGMPFLFVAAGSGAGPLRGAAFIAATGAIVGAIDGLGLLALVGRQAQMPRPGGPARAILAAGA
jgi:hypothetical protein